MRLTLKRIALLTLVAVATGACGSSPPKGIPARTEFVLQGTLQDAGGRPLSRAGVALVGSPLGGLTSATGAFRVKGVPPASIRLTVIYLGYRSTTVPLASTGEEPVELTLPMTRDAALGPALADSMEAVTVLYTLRPASGT